MDIFIGNWNKYQANQMNILTIMKFLQIFIAAYLKNKFWYSYHGY